VATVELTKENFDEVVSSSDMVVLYSQPGALPGAPLEELITRAGDLDMAEVHRQLADHQAEQGAS